MEDKKIIDDKNEEKVLLEPSDELNTEADLSQVKEDIEEEWQDILGSGQLLKKVLKKGINDSRPQRLDVCTVKYVGKYEDNIVDEGLVTINVGDIEVVQGLDMVLALMDVEEEAEIIVGPRFAYGSQGKTYEPKGEGPDIPPDATLRYTATLLSAEPEPLIETLSLEERKEIGNRKKVRGNFWYSRNDHTLAIQCYRRSLDYLDDKGLSNVSEEDVNSLLDDRLKAYNNLAAAQLKIKAFDSALQSVENVLKCQPDNIKALFRKGKILGEKGDTSEGMAFLKKTLALDPDNEPAKLELNKLLARQKRDTEEEKKLYKKMLGTNNKPSNNKEEEVSNNYSKWGVVAGCVGVVCSVMAYRWLKPI